VRLGRVTRRVVIGAVLFLFIIALLAWAGGGQPIPVGVVNLLSNTLSISIPIMLGALTAVICSTSGVINIAIEGQLLLGAFCAAIATTVTGSLWLGLVCGAAAGSLVAALLAVFAIAYRVDQVVLGVVLNALVLGLTGYLYNAIMVPYGDTLNNPSTFSPWKFPGLGDIPIIGPVFFDSTIFLYLTYILLAVVQIGLFRTRWGLRTRAIGEHPTAADTGGIRAASYSLNLACKSYEALDAQISTSSSGRPPRYLPSLRDVPPYSGRMRRKLSGCGVAGRSNEVALWPLSVPRVDDR